MQIPQATWRPHLCYGCSINSKPAQIYFLAFGVSKMGEQKLGFRPRDHHGEIQAGILRGIPVSMSQMVRWRPIWWQRCVIWSPLGFRARTALPRGSLGALLGPNLEVDRSESKYSRSKAEGENQLLEHFPNGKILRPSLLYGKGDNSVSYTHLTLPTN